MNGRGEGRGSVRDDLALMKRVFAGRPGHYIFHPLGATHYFDDLNERQRALDMPVTADKPLGIIIDAARFIVPAVGVYTFFR